jgi:hypothetical protein
VCGWMFSCQEFAVWQYSRVPTPSHPQADMSPPQIRLRQGFDVNSLKAAALRLDQQTEHVSSPCRARVPDDKALATGQRGQAECPCRMCQGRAGARCSAACVGPSKASRRRCRLGRHGGETAEGAAAQSDASAEHIAVKRGQGRQGCIIQLQAAIGRQYCKHCAIGSPFHVDGGPC